jgi:hypothetical protein
MNYIFVWVLSIYYENRYASKTLSVIELNWNNSSQRTDKVTFDQEQFTLNTDFKQQQKPAVYL